VPGEADDWCALHAKNSSMSLILTSDTDLLLYEYPPETLILFFSDADLTAGIKAYSPHQIRQKLQVKTLLSYAFALRDGYHDTATDLAANARKVDLDSVDYVEFSRRYTAAAVAPTYLLNSGPHAKVLPDMDVRVSEFVHQALDASPTTLVYLPLLVEDPNQASAWNIGVDIRTMAYSLLAHQNSIIQEYKRKAQGIAAQEISIYSSSNIIVLMMDFERQLNTLKEWATSNGLGTASIWPLFALSLVLPELNSPPVVPLVLRVLNSDFDNSWTYVHLLARLQAAMYSLRMLKQTIAVYLALDDKTDRSLRDHLSSIQTHMADFPTIAEMFTVPGQTKNVLAEHEQLRTLVEEIYRSAGAEVPTEQISNKKKKRQMREADRKKKKAEQRQQPKMQVANAYTLLDG
jgi:hypothetical protein